MNCSDLEKVIPQLAGSGLIDANTQTGALRHVETCALCAARLADERMLISGVRAVRAEIASEQAPPQVEQVLVSAFRERVTEVRTPLACSMPEACVPAPMPQRNRLWFTWKVAAIAAMILFFTAIGTIVLVRSRPGEIPPQTKVEVAPLIPQSPAPGPQIADVPAPGKAPAHRQRANRSTRRAETVTEYFPLIEGEDLESVEFTQVVRVELTPSALREVGLPLSYASESEYVKADVVLGHDGIARAIRFVR